MPAVADALLLVAAFTPQAEDEKSHELIAAVLEHTPAPFSRSQFNPGHITCTAVVLDTERRRVLLGYHHRLRRWLLPGGHVEETDASLGGAAAREATEETSVRLVAGAGARLVGMDVHGIPANPSKDEPYHLHHDLIFEMTAESDVVVRSEEATEVAWCAIDETELARYGVPSSIVRAVKHAVSR
jgi:8-oxo-dGTP pyrophosphatase MutT (NUDIX family)